MNDRTNPPTAEAPVPEPKKSSVANFLKKTGLTVLLALIAFTIFLGASHEGRAAVKTTLFIPHVFNAGIKPLNWFTPDPVVERVTFPIPGGAGTGDIYRPPGEGPYAAVLLFLGVAPAGSDDPRVVRLGDALARSNMVTLFYWSPIMADGRMEPEDVDNLVAAFQYLSAQNYVDKSRVGMGGFCVGASFSIMAASEAPIRDNVAFVNAFGPYFDMRDLIGAISSGTKSYGDETLSWEPNKLSRKVFITHLTQDPPGSGAPPLARRISPTTHPLKLQSRNLFSPRRGRLPPSKRHSPGRSEGAIGADTPKDSGESSPDISQPTP